MPPSDLLCLLLAAAAAARRLAPAGHVHAQSIITPASANLSTSWTTKLSSDGGEQCITYANRMAMTVFLLQPIQAHIREDGPGFAACFYCNTNVSYTGFYFGVCIVRIDNSGYLSFSEADSLQVVWSANRDQAVRDNATLSFMASGNLELRDTNGSVVWSIGTSGQSVAGMTVTKSGNLVLFDDKNAVVWQSFDHPTDCLLPGTKCIRHKLEDQQSAVYHCPF